MSAPRRTRWFRRLTVIALIVLPLSGLVLAVDRLGRVPETQADAEAHLQREIWDYDVWDGTPYIVFSRGDTVFFDRLILDWVSIAWPPTPRWQWTGNWSSIDTTDAPASAAARRVEDDTVVFGQINDPAMTMLELRIDGEWHRFAVSAPGYAVRIPDAERYPDRYRGLDAEGRVVWELERGG